jgi:AAA ATPase domain
MVVVRANAGDVQNGCGIAPGGAVDVGADGTLFRAYDEGEFLETGSWRHLRMIIATGNGGVYGLYGPRGSGKSWLMGRAITEATAIGGIGLWFPCPSGYEPTAFLSMLADTLARKVEDLRAGPADSPALRKSGPQRRARRRENRRLARQAAELRERVRFATTSLKRSSQASLSVSYHGAAGISRTRERDLAEREPTVASLVFDFRRFAASVATVLRPLVIAIDELDKIDSPDTVRALLRDIKGIFEIPHVYFLVSVSDEAAAALHLGALRGRDEFNSSFYTVLEMELLDPVDASRLAGKRGTGLTDEEARLLCLLGAGNWRDVVRLAEEWRRSGGRADVSALARRSLGTEAAALLREIVRAGGAAGDPNAPGRAVLGPTDGRGTATGAAAPSSAAVNTVLTAAWKALPAGSFTADGSFDELSRYVIRDHWDLLSSRHWPDAPAEAWRRYLIRLFVVGRALAGIGRLDERDVADLRNVLIQAGLSADVARFMLQDRFGPDLDGSYSRPPG